MVCERPLRSATEANRTSLRSPVAQCACMAPPVCDTSARQSIRVTARLHCHADWMELLLSSPLFSSLSLPLWTLLLVAGGSGRAVVVVVVGRRIVVLLRRTRVSLARAAARRTAGRARARSARRSLLTAGAAGRGGGRVRSAQVARSHVGHAAAALRARVAAVTLLLAHLRAHKQERSK